MNLFETLAESLNPSKKTHEAIRVSHGNAFGSGNWYTWHCPNCNKTLTEKINHCCGNEVLIINK